MKLKYIGKNNYVDSKFGYKKWLPNEICECPLSHAGYLLESYPKLFTDNLEKNAEIKIENKMIDTQELKKK